MRPLLLALVLLGCGTADPADSSHAANHPCACESSRLCNGSDVCPTGLVCASIGRCVEPDAGVDAGAGTDSGTDSGTDTGAVDAGGSDSGTADTGLLCTEPDRRVVCGGRCVSLATDPANCGSCGHVCPAGAHASGACVGGRCDVRCDRDWGNCGGGIACTTPLVTASNCGSCEAGPCSSRQRCERDDAGVYACRF